jgi:exosortase A-associated hydrolase 2
MPHVLQPAFVAGSAGRLFVSCFAPADGADTWLLFVPPFAEEMNKSRRMLARLGYALAAEGIGLCLPDLHGTGDSEGDFGAARMAIWQRDLADVAGWLQAEHGCRRLLLGGLRYGALLAMSSRGQLPDVTACLLWQPVAKGQQQLTQFLRLRQAAAIMGGGGRETLKDLQQQLDHGQPLEVAGYLLHPELAQAMTGQDLVELAPPAGLPVHWLELARDPARPLMPASAQVIEAWQGQGSQVSTAGVPGDPFWSTQELVDAPELLAASLHWLRETLAS